MIFTILGMVKHARNGEWDRKTMIKKAGIEWCIATCAIILGFVGAMLLFVIARLAQMLGATSLSLKPEVAYYVIFAACISVCLYYLIGCMDMFNKMRPGMIADWLQKPFRNVQKSGKFDDLYDVVPGKEDL